MRILADYHHAGAAQAQALLLHRRLWHTIFFPGESFVQYAIQQEWTKPGDMLPCLPGWLRTMYGYPEYRNEDWPFIVDTYEQVMDTDWDIFLVTRIETQAMFFELKKRHPRGDKIKLVGLTGNDNTKFEWDRIPNLMSSDYATYRNSPDSLHKIWYSQEIGQHYFDKYVPIKEESLRTVNQFVNCFPSMRGPWHERYDMAVWDGVCPYCHAKQDGAPLDVPIDPYGIWLGAKERLPAHKFEEYGIGCSHGCVPEYQLPWAYASGAATVHFKTYDGYGFSMLQSIAMGRPVIVPENFHRFRTAGKYLIPNLTCYTAEWDSKSLANTIRYLTRDVNQANAMGYSCWLAAQGIFNFTLESARVSDFLEGLR